MLNALWIFVGGGLGSLARWWLSGYIASTVGQTFPWGTLVVNVSGCFVIGLFATVTGPEGRWLAPASFSLQTLNLVQEGELLYAGANVMLSVAACLVAVWLGHLLATRF